MFVKTHRKLVSIVEEFITQFQDENDFPWSLSVESDNVSGLEIEDIIHDLGIEDGYDDN